MIDLHETLSEFTYGYGITREIEGLLQSSGLKATPFLPSLLHEGVLGFDVAFNQPGRPLMLQFKLGQEMQRLRTSSGFKPTIARPFWRYRLNVSERQFKTLLAQERRGAEVYYVAPQFSSWAEYQQFFVQQSVLENSSLVTPTRIKTMIGSSPGLHSVIYDTSVDYVCSEPREVKRVHPKQMADELSVKIRENPIPLETAISRLLSKREMKTDVRQLEFLDRLAPRMPHSAALLGLKAWTLGAQLVFVTLKK